MVHIRRAKEEDLIAILDIYNQGIRNRIATLETEEKDLKYMSDWFLQRSDKYAVLTAAIEHEVAGWASLKPYSHRCAYRGVADLSIYISRSYRGRGIGKALLASIEKEAVDADIHKIVLFTFPFNMLGQGLYSSMGYRQVGILKSRGNWTGNMLMSWPWRKF